MSQDGSERGKRCLAGIESDLIKAEEAFADADARFKKAELDRQTALETINKHQIEMDNFISDMRQHSVPGTKWHPSQSASGDTLELHNEDMVRPEPREEPGDLALSSEENKRLLSKDFSKARETKESANERGDDPVLKVVSGKSG